MKNNKLPEVPKSTMEYRAHLVENTRLKVRPFNARLIPKKLEQLAKSGVYFDDRVL